MCACKTHGWIHDLYLKSTTETLMSEKIIETRICFSFLWSWYRNRRGFAKGGKIIQNKHEKQKHNDEVMTEWWHLWTRKRQSGKELRPKKYTFDTGQMMERYRQCWGWTVTVLGATGRKPGLLSLEIQWIHWTLPEILEIHWTPRETVWRYSHTGSGTFLTLSAERAGRCQNGQPIFPLFLVGCAVFVWGAPSPPS